MTRRVVLIDDAMDLADHLTFALRDHGYDVAPSGYTHHVDELVARTQAVAVVLGCSTFDMSESLFDVVRAEPAHAELPVVIITDAPDDAVAALRAREARRVLVVPKPFRAAQVVAALEQLLGPEQALAEPEGEGGAA